MKNIFSRLVLLVSVALLIQLSADATIRVKIKGRFKGGVLKSARINLPRESMRYDHLKHGNVYGKVNGDQFSFTIERSSPGIAFISFDYDSNYYRQPIFLDHGYDLTINCTAQGNKVIITTSGKGANDNQQLSSIDWIDQAEFSQSGDSLPYKVFEHITNGAQQNNEVLAQYIRDHQPSIAFINAWRINMSYSILSTYYSFAEQRKFSIRDAYFRNQSSWDSITNKLMEANSLSNDTALYWSVPAYLTLIRNYLGRTKERLWIQGSGVNNNTFFKDWYGGDVTAAKNDFKDDKQNNLLSKIIQRSYTGNIKEYMYACLFDEALYTSNPKNLIAIYNNFLNEFPSSPYKDLFNAPMQAVIEKMKNSLTNKMVFLPNGDSLTNFEQVLSLVKGKTLLLDMWGTWCGPCREEIEKNGEAIKTYFKGKGLDYLYIANYDNGNDSKWKEMISYLKLEGYHIMAKEVLSLDIMKKLGGSGYPTYAIIKADGSYELSKAGYPMDRNLLIQQLEAALKD